MLEIKNISKIYIKNGVTTPALDNVSITIGKGEIFALLGVNGAGKTTLSSIIATLHPATSGNILLDGVSIYNDLKSYRRMLGFCPQYPNLDSYLTVEENLIYAGHYFLLPAEAIQQRVTQLMKKFNLARYAQFQISALSGGYKQRVSIARALIHQPKIIIFDEPTVGLDPHIRRQLWDIIKELKEDGITSIITTHYLDEAEVLADRVCILNKGKILLTKSVEEIKKEHSASTLEEAFLTLMRNCEREEICI